MIGTLKWSRTTGGKLRLIDKLSLAQQAIRMRRLMRKRAHLSFPELAFDPEDISIPHSKVAFDALAVAERLSDKYLLNHCLRTYCWASLLAKARGLKPDIELLFVSAILHDLGLTHDHQLGAAGEHCFAVTGARLAREAISEHAWNSERLDSLEEAISLHLNIMVPAEKYGVEAHLLQAGAATDMIGSGLPEIQGLGVETTLLAYPRCDHKQNMRQAMIHQCSIHPNSRIDFLTKRGFLDLVDAAPFAS